MVETGKIFYTWIVRIAIVKAVNCRNFALIGYWLHFYQLREQHTSPLTPRAQQLPSCTVSRESLEVTLIPPNPTKPERSGGLFLPLFVVVVRPFLKADSFCTCGQDLLIEAPRPEFYSGVKSETLKKFIKLCLYSSRGNLAMSFYFNMKHLLLDLIFLIADVII